MVYHVSVLSNKSFISWPSTIALIRLCSLYYLFESLFFIVNGFFEQVFSMCKLIENSNLQVEEGTALNKRLILSSVYQLIQEVEGKLLLFSPHHGWLFSHRLVNIAGNYHS